MILRKREIGSKKRCTPDCEVQGAVITNQAAFRGAVWRTKEASSPCLRFLIHPRPENHGGLLKPIILVACVEAKADKPGKAEDFYRSPYFKKCLTWARSVATDHCIRIVSGKYGLLRLNDQVGRMIRSCSSPAI